MGNSGSVEEQAWNCAAGGRDDRLRQLMAQRQHAGCWPAVVEWRNARDGSTPLLAALARAGGGPDDRFERVVALLLEHGADVNAPNSMNGDSPLHVAAVRNCARAIERLLDHGANPAARNSRGVSALEQARAVGSVTAVQQIEARCARFRGELMVEVHGDIAQSVGFVGGQRFADLVTRHIGGRWERRWCAVLEWPGAIEELAIYSGPRVGRPEMTLPLGFSRGAPFTHEVFLSSPATETGGRRLLASLTGAAKPRNEIQLISTSRQSSRRLAVGLRAESNEQFAALQSALTPSPPVAVAHGAELPPPVAHAEVVPATDWAVGPYAPGAEADDTDEALERALEMSAAEAASHASSGGAAPGAVDDDEALRLAIELSRAEVAQQPSRPPQSSSSAPIAADDAFSMARAARQEVAAAPDRGPAYAPPMTSHEPDDELARLLRGADLEKYLLTLRAHDINDVATLRAMTDDDFSAIGMPLGACVRLRALTGSPAAAEAAPGPTAPQASPPASEIECVICFELGPPRCVLTPCGHLCVCLQCSRDLGECPICRTPVERVQEIFQS